MSLNKKLNVGDEVPDFTLADQKKDKFILSEYFGKRKVLLSFHPLAWTPVCAQQMASIEENYETFLENNVIPVGVSVDSASSKAAWADELGLIKTRLLADFWPHGQLADSLGILREEGFSERANYLLDENGRIIFKKIYAIPEFPDINEVLDFIKNQEEK